MPTFNERPMLTAWISEPLFGRWVADVVASGSDPVGEVALLDIDGVTWSGRVVEQVADGPRLTARIVGGANGLENILLAKWYRGGTSLRRVVGDVLDECGETLSAASDLDLLAVPVPQYERLAQPAWSALRDVLRRYGASWRVTRAGAIQVVPDEWLPSTEAGEYRLVESSAADARHTIAVNAPTVEPGQLVEGDAVRRIAWYLSTTLRADLFTSDDRKPAQADGSTVVATGVNSQAADGSLDLIAAASYGLTGVPLHGLPGCEVLVPPGIQTLLAYDGGDTRRPVAFGVRGGSGLKLGTLVTGTASGPPPVMLPPAFFPAGTVGDAAAVAYAAALVLTPGVAYSTEITTAIAEVLP